MLENIVHLSVWSSTSGAGIRGEGSANTADNRTPASSEDVREYLRKPFGSALYRNSGRKKHWQQLL